MNALSWKMKVESFPVFRLQHKAWVPMCTRVPKSRGSAFAQGACGRGATRSRPVKHSRQPTPGHRVAASPAFGGGRGTEGDGDGRGQPAGALPSSVPKLRADMARATAAVASSSTPSSPPPSPSCVPPPRLRRARPAPVPLGAGPATSAPGPSAPGPSASVCCPA